jgi:rare lipoprotein A
MRRRTAQTLAAVLFVAGVGAARGPNTIPARSAPISRSSPRAGLTRTNLAWVKNSAQPYQVGTASWYGEDFMGKATASGEPYNMYDLTAAHPTLPLGTFVRVTNLRNGRTAVLRINDRGPIVPGRIIDVSYGAAQALRFKSQGLQRVRLDVVPPPEMVAEIYPPLAY